MLQPGDFDLNHRRNFVIPMDILTFLEVYSCWHPSFLNREPKVQSDKLTLTHSFTKHTHIKLIVCLSKTVT